MSIVRQLGSSHNPITAVVPANAEIRTEFGNSYGFFNSEYEFVQRLATHCEQSPGNFLIANFRSNRSTGGAGGPRHGISLFTIHESRVPGSGDEPGSRRAVLARCRDTSRAVLPETLNRVESLVSHRKHTLGCASTRDTGCRRSRSFSQPYAAVLHLIFTSHQSPVTTHDL
jgi:hypothetical protein